jgi:hypothetical protein
MKPRYSGKYYPGLVHPVENGDAFIVDGDDLLTDEQVDEFMRRGDEGERVNVADFLKEHGIEDTR